MRITRRSCGPADVPTIFKQIAGFSVRPDRRAPRPAAESLVPAVLRAARSVERGFESGMRGRFVSQIAILFAVLTLAVGGCSSKTTPDAAGDEGSSRVSEFDQGAGSSPVTEERVRGDVKLDSIYFDFDRWDIRSDAKPILQANARTIKSSELKRVVIEGNCDERGSEEYNLALGERRAAAARDYLTDLGVSRSRLRIVSFGESNPAVLGHDESAWRWNRRNEFVGSN